MDVQPNANAGTPQDENDSAADKDDSATPIPGDSAGMETAPVIAKQTVTIDYGPLTKHRLPWGVAGVFMWMLLFSVGVLIPAESSRKNLGWKSDSETQANAKKLEERIGELEKKVTKPDAPKNPKTTDSTKPETQKEPATQTSSEGAPTTSPGTPPVVPDVSQNSPKQNEPPITDTKDQNKEEPTSSTQIYPSKFWSFVVATFTFTPLNVGILCILAAFIGGCSVNKSEIHRIQQEILDLEAKPPVPPNPDLTRLRQRLDYLTEHPGYSTIRGLVVYLIIISGLFIIGAPLTGENGTQAVTLAQYMKLAGLFSFFGYLSGYDPTVFSAVIGLGTKQLNTNKT